MQPDLVIRSGTVFDGSGRPGIVADVAIADGRIAALGRIDAPEAPSLDATGAYVTPGFIDIHSHSDFTLLVDPRAVSSITQGVTLEVIGNCGHGCFPIADRVLARNAIYGISDAVPLAWSTPAAYLDRLEQAEPAVNVLTLVPNGQLRLACVGMHDRPAETAELRAMTARLEEGLEAGAWGYSTGLEYAAESGAPEAEIAALCGTVARADALYASHTRYRDQGSVSAVEEAIRTARQAGVRLQVSHLLPRDGRASGERCIELVERARDDGQDIAYDMHTRRFGLTFLHAMLPPWVHEDRSRTLEEKVRDPAIRERIRTHRNIVSSGGFERVVLLDNEVAPEFARLSLVEIAAKLGMEPLDAALRILARADGAPVPPMVILKCYDESEQLNVFAHDMCVPASDATALATDGPLSESAFHGAYTWASWFYRFMVREHRALTPEAAIRKLTGQPSDTLRLPDRGYLRPAMRADIAVFDPARFGERGTTFDPNRIAEGMRHVVVNGRPTLVDGILTGTRAGQVLRRRG